MMNIRCFIKVSLLIGGILLHRTVPAQELYVFSEPASNIPAKSISVKGTGKFVNSNMNNNFMQRYMPEVMIGLHKNLMVSSAVTFSDMYTNQFRWESVKLYTKYRFLSSDDIHKHFRMAAFAAGSYSRNKPMYEELSLDGDQSGLQLGLVATQLVNKLAVSATGGYLLYAGSRQQDPKLMPYQALKYNLSAGYLVLPFDYANFEQTNLNLYAELLGQQSLDRKGYYVDFAPAVQLIFNSNTKFNLGYRFQLGGNIHRMGERGWLISLERTFLGVL